MTDLDLHADSVTLLRRLVLDRKLTDYDPLAALELVLADLAYLDAQVLFASPKALSPNAIGLIPRQCHL